MAEPFPYDRVAKDIFFHDSPTLLHRVTGGRPIGEIVNSELPKTLERRADMVLLVGLDELHHLEFQADNFPGLPYRQGVDCFLLAERYPDRRIIQTVFFLGNEPLRMPSELDTGAGVIRYRIVDLRDFTVDEIVAGGRPADLVLALLARDGREKLPELLRRIGALPPPGRRRALAQIALMAGLRRIASVVKMEMERQGMYIDIAENEILRDVYERVKQESLAEGLAKGRVEGASLARSAFRSSLASKFGPLPSWAEARLREASVEQLRLWLRRSSAARSLAGVLGRK